MKKFIVSILCMLYMMTSSGFAMNVHYCMGKVSGWNIDILPSAEKCPCGSKKKKNSCCKTETKVVKLNNAYKASSALYNIHSPEKAVYYNNASYSFHINEPKKNLVQISPKLPPPIISSISQLVKNCVFRI